MLYPLSYEGAYRSLREGGQSALLTRCARTQHISSRSRCFTKPLSLEIPTGPP